MPYKKISVPFIEMSRLLKGYDLDPPALANVLGCSTPTARRKLASPENLTLKDIRRIHMYGHVPIQEIREAIKG